MPRVPGNSDRASTFLRAFRTSPAGPPPDAWPAPAVLRRWLRRPAFRAALRSLHQSLRLQADFHLATAATRAASSLDTATDPNATNAAGARLTQLLRLAHLRERFPNPANLLHREPKGARRKKITRLDVVENLHLVDPQFRLDDDELHAVATRNGYYVPLEHRPDFPAPQPGLDSVYYDILHNSTALLRYLDLFDQTTDHRFSHILTNCKHLLPRDDDPDHPLPGFRPAPAPDPEPPPAPAPPTDPDP